MAHSVTAVDPYPVEGEETVLSAVPTPHMVAVHTFDNESQSRRWSLNALANAACLQAMIIHRGAKTIETFASV